MGGSTVVPVLPVAGGAFVSAIDGVEPTMRAAPTIEVLAKPRASQPNPGNHPDSFAIRLDPPVIEQTPIHRRASPVQYTETPRSATRSSPNKPTIGPDAAHQPGKFVGCITGTRVSCPRPMSKSVTVAENPPTR